MKIRIKTGIDIVLNSRIEKLIKNKGFLEKVFHPSEINDADVKKLAGLIRWVI